MNKHIKEESTWGDGFRLRQLKRWFQSAYCPFCAMYDRPGEAFLSRLDGRRPWERVPLTRGSMKKT